MLKVTKVFIFAALIYLVLWITAMLFGDLSTSGLLTNDVLWTLANEDLQIHLAAFGFISMMIFGFGYLLIPRFLNTALFSENIAMVHAILSNIAAAGLAVLTWYVDRSLQGIFSTLWLLGAILFVWNVMMTVRRRPRETRAETDFLERRKVDRLASILTVGSVSYLLLSSSLLLLESLLGGLSFQGWHLSPVAIVHLHFLGFVVLMVFGVAYHLMPRLMGSLSSRKLVAIVAAFGVPGSAAVSLQVNQQGWPFIVAAWSEAIAAIVFSCSFYHMYWRRTRNIPAIFFNLASVTFLLAGVSLGVAFALDPGLRILRPVHAFLNMFGFVAMMIFGVNYHVFPMFSREKMSISFGRGYVNLISALAGILMVTVWRSIRLFGVLGTELLILLGDFLILLAVLIFATHVARSLRVISLVGLQIGEEQGHRP